MKKKVLIACAAVFALLLAVYLGFAFYFSSHYLWHTKINAIKYGGKTADQAVKRNTELSRDYMLTITDRKGNSFSLKGPDFSYEYVSTGDEEKILKSQNAFTWPASIFKSYSYDLKASSKYDDTKLEEQLKSLDIFSDDYIEKPEDARIEISDGTYTVVNEKPGNKPVYDQILSEVKTSLDNEAPELTLSDSCYETPAITVDSDLITSEKAALDKYTAATVTYDIEGYDEKLDSAKILDMLDISEDGSVTINDEKLTKYVQHLASTYNTYGRKRSFKTSSGDTIEIGGGDYGWVVSKKNEKAQLLEDLEGGTPVEREPVYEQTALYRGADDIGNTYIEIDYTKQHMWYYKDGSLVMESDIVSGNLATHNGSVDGVYKIVYKQRDATLVGEGYSSPVSYFMPFAYNIGIHDASWRSSFGGTTYKTSGSHGCINVPPDFAEALFNAVDKGTPVVAYYREDVTLTNNAAKMSNAYSYKAQEQ